MITDLEDELRERRELVENLRQLLGECCVAMSEVGDHCSWEDLPERIRLLKGLLKERQNAE